MNITVKQAAAAVLALTAAFVGVLAALGGTAMESTNRSATA